MKSKLQLAFQQQMDIHDRCMLERDRAASVECHLLTHVLQAIQQQHVIALGVGVFAGRYVEHVQKPTSSKSTIRKAERALLMEIRNCFVCSDQCGASLSRHKGASRPNLWQHTPVCRTINHKRPHPTLQL